MAKEAQNTLIGNMVGDTINNARYIVDFLQETMGSNSGDALSEEASVGLFNILGMVSNTLSAAGKQVDAIQKEHHALKDWYAMWEAEKKEPPKRKGAKRG